MSWEPRPLPRIRPETEEFWAKTAQETFLLCECQDCGLIYYYPRSYCPDCWGDDLEYVESSQKGSVYTYSVVEQFEGWPDQHLPLIVAFVELEEGPKMLTNIVDTEPTDVHVGMCVTMEFIDSEQKDIAIPVFRPSDD